jgi:hypothetical protein
MVVHTSRRGHQHVDGAGKVDGSVVVALPIDKWSAPEHVNSFIGHGGGLTFWDGRKDPVTKELPEIHYETRSGDIAFIDRYVTMRVCVCVGNGCWYLVCCGFRWHDMTSGRVGLFGLC